VLHAPISTVTPRSKILFVFNGRSSFPSAPPRTSIQVFETGSPARFAATGRNHDFAANGMRSPAGRGDSLVPERSSRSP
jgi:hypothetical protein